MGTLLADLPRKTEAPWSCPATPLSSCREGRRLVYMQKSLSRLHGVIEPESYNNNLRRNVLISPLGNNVASGFWRGKGHQLASMVF